MTTRSRLAALLGAAVLTLALAACSSSGSSNHQAQAHLATANGKLKPPPVHNYLDYHNYYKAQEVYDDPTTIQWCTFTWGNANSPLVTVPIAGKLTSSSVSLFPSQQVKKGQDNSTYNPELVSVDGMFHGSPPPYRFGFTPGGQYVDFNGSVPTFCTTALTKFQRASSTVDVTNDPKMVDAQTQAEAALRACNQVKHDGSVNCPAAQKALQHGLGQ